jgi:hypothetical protein
MGTSMLGTSTRETTNFVLDVPNFLLGSEQKLITRNPRTKLITIYVGNNRTQFVIYEKLLCDTTNFLKAPSGLFKESEGVIHLQEESPNVFSPIVDLVV